MDCKLPYRLPALKRGGARCSAQRHSSQLTKKQCSNLIDAAGAAWAAGMPFNRFITLAWELGGIDPTRSVAVTGEFVKLAREWIMARGYPMPWAWVQEWGPRFGAHCHMLLCVPQELEPLFRPMPKRWARKLLGGVYVAGVVQSQRLQSAFSSNTALYEAQLLGKVHYMLKCAPAGLEAQLGMMGKGHKPWGQSCPVYGKRAGLWQGWRQAIVC